MNGRRALGSVAVVVGAAAALLGADPGDAVERQPRDTAAAPYDVDGDGFAELAVGVPGYDVGRALDAGALSLSPGSSRGTTAQGNRLVHQASARVVGSNERNDRWGTSVASGDFDGDGFADLLVGAPGEDPATEVDRPGGAFTVLPGSAQGIGTVASRRLQPASLGLVDAWGDVAAVGDLDGDGFDDAVLAGLDFNAHTHGGVTVVYGSAAGLDLARTVHLTDAAARGEDAADAPDRFGRALAVGDLTGDGVDDLAVSTHRQGTGAVAVFRGGATTVSTRAAQVLDQDSADLAVPGAGYQDLGVALAVGDFDGDRVGDLALSDWDARPPGVRCRPGGCPGAVLVVPGASGGPAPDGRRLVSRATPGVPGEPRPGDLFGWSLAAGDFDADGRDDLAVGTKGATTGGRPQSGAVLVLRGSAGGLSGAGARALSQGTPGVPGVDEDFDFFGAALRAVDLGRGSATDLVVRADGERVGTAEAAGSATVLNGSAADGLTGRGARLWTLATPGVRGVVQPYAGFGALED